jgi:hypothetical protein
LLVPVPKYDVDIENKIKKLTGSTINIIIVRLRFLICDDRLFIQLIFK